MTSGLWPICFLNILHFGCGGTVHVNTELTALSLFTQIRFFSVEPLGYVLRIEVIEDSCMSKIEKEDHLYTPVLLICDGLFSIMKKAVMSLRWITELDCFFVYCPSPRYSRFCQHELTQSHARMKQLSAGKQKHLPFLKIRCVKCKLYFYSYQKFHWLNSSSQWVAES